MPASDDPEEIARRREILDWMQPELDALFAPTKFEAASDVASFALALRKLDELERDFTKFYEREWLVRAGKAPPPIEVGDCSQGCRLIREAAERVGIREIPALPEPPVSLGRYHLFRQRVVETAERQIAKPGTSLTFMPAAWFVENTAIPLARLRKAAGRPDGATYVRSVGAARSKRYCVEDAQRHWPHDFERRTKPSR